MEILLLFISMIVVLIRRAIDKFFGTPAATIKPTPTIKPVNLFPAASVTSYPDPNQMPWARKVAHLERYIIHSTRSNIPRHGENGKLVPVSEKSSTDCYTLFSFQPTLRSHTHCYALRSRRNFVP